MNLLEHVQLLHQQLSNAVKINADLRNEALDRRDFDDVDHHNGIVKSYVMILDRLEFMLLNHEVTK